MATDNTDSFWIESEDWHTAGEPFRIIDKLPVGYLPEEKTVAERRFSIINTLGHPLDLLRQSLCHEPRGHADMYGGFITPPNDPQAHFGVLFWHKDGFSTACGHGTIALGYWAVSKGLVPIPEEDGVVDVVIDVASGRVTANVMIKQGKPCHADFINVLSYQLEKDLSVSIPSYNRNISLNLAFSGAVYATVDVFQLGLKVDPGRCDDFIKLGREIKSSLGARANYKTYDLYGIIFFSEESDGQAESEFIRQRNVTVFADGQIDRSPCGSGTCARLAILLAEGRLGAGRSKLLHKSIIGSTFEGDIISEEKGPISGGSIACIPRVRGHANLVGRMNFFIDPSDTIFPGFLLR